MWPPAPEAGLAVLVRPRRREPAGAPSPVLGRITRHTPCCGEGRYRPRGSGPAWCSGAADDGETRAVGPRKPCPDERSTPPSPPATHKSVYRGNRGQAEDSIWGRKPAMAGLVRSRSLSFISARDPSNRERHLLAWDGLPTCDGQLRALANRREVCVSFQRHQTL